MRKLLFSAAAGASLLLFAGGALADGYRSGVRDLGCATPFQGFYAGVNVGAAQFKSHQNDLDGYLIDNTGYTVSENSFTGGVQIG
jgi:hypothetical protein